MLGPLWQVAIGVCVLVVVIISTRRLVRRGPSRMGRALIVTGGAALAVFVIGMLLATR